MLQGDSVTIWRLQTEADPLATARRFLGAVWQQANLDGMLVLLYQPGKMAVEPMLIDDPQRLADADPFVPLVQVNAARLVAQAARQYPEKRLAVVLRACEIRALAEIVKNEALNLDNWLVIGADCLACFPAQDFDWRVQRAGDVEQLTRQALRNARQGGIALSRFRLACQMCSKPEPMPVDLCLGLLGLPVKETMLVIPKDKAVSERLKLHQLTDGPADVQHIEQRRRVLAALNERRRHFRDQLMQVLPHDLPEDIDQLVVFLTHCQPCQVCYTSCPLYSDELAPLLENGSVTQEMVKRWLAVCADCGMCEQACPKDVPLAAIMDHINRKMKPEMVAV